MTAGNGFPAGMDRFALDAGTAERLVSGAVDVADAPPEYRAVASVLLALREPPDSWELVGGPAVAERIAATVSVARTERAVPRSRRFASRTRVAVASLVASGLALTGGLAAAGALPDPAQRVASAVLDQVGISVPTGDEPARRGTAPTTADPKPTTAGSVQSNPTAVSPSAPPPVPHDAPVPAPVGSGQQRARYTRADGEGPSAHDTPPGNGNGNAYGSAKAGGSANGNGNGNGNANANANGNANANADGNGNANANANDKEKANGTASTDVPLDASLVPATLSP
jgi:type IV secretory pathway VirB10-like protein